MVKILLVDEQDIFRAGLCALFEREPGVQVVGEAGTCAAAIRLAKELAPDILVTEVKFTSCDSLAMIARLKFDSPALQIIVLSSCVESDLPGKAFHAGASAYLPKQAKWPELLDAVRAVQQRNLYIHPSLTHLLIKRFDLRPAGKSPEVTLSAREMDVLRLLVQGRTNREIADALHIGVRTVETHRARLLEKLGLRGRAELVDYARRFGLVTDLAKRVSVVSTDTQMETL